MTASHLLATPYDVELTWLDDRRVAFPVLSDRTEYRWVEPATGASGRFAPGVGRKALPDRDTIVRSLLAEGGNVARTARQLGLHRNQLRRFLARHPDLAAGDGDEPG